MNDPLKQKWFLLGPPWAHSNDSGFTILAGHEDPHIGKIILDTQDFSDEGLGNENCRAIAQHIIDLHNKAIESNWQPIKTAPKDGTEILGYRADCGIILVRYTSCDAFMTEQEINKLGLSEEEIFQQDWFYADFLQGGRLVDDEAPTHWAPLPEQEITAP